MLGALGCLVVVTLGLVAVPVGPVPAQDRSPGPVTLRGIALDSWVAGDGTWTFDLAVEGAPSGAAVAGSLYEDLADRGELAPTLFGELDGDRVATIPPQDLDPATPAIGGGTAARLAITLRSDEPTRAGHRFLPDGLGPGVYPVEVVVVDDDGDTLARTVVYLTRVASGPDEGDGEPPMLVAPVLELGGPPSVDPDGRVQVSPATISEVAGVADGLAATDDLPTTLVPRPETIEALVREPDGSDALDALRVAAASRQVVDGPYVDVPVNAWIERGMSDELTRQRERGNRILAEQLNRIDSSLWVARDGLTPSAAAELWSVGVRSVILGPGTTVDAEADEGADAPVSPATVDAGPSRTLTALTADAGLSDGLQRSELRGGPRDAVLDENGLAAELALIDDSAEGPAGVVLLTPEGWPSDAFAVARLGTLLQDPLSPVRPATVAELLDAVPARGFRALAPGALADLGDYPGRLALARSRLTSYTSLVGDADPEVIALDQRLLLSGARTLTPPEQQAYVDSVLTTLEARLGDVVAPPEQTITLTATDADIPLTLRNRLEVPVTVVISLASDSRVEFRGEGARIVRELVPGDQEIRIPIHTRVPGDAPIDITIRTPDDAIELDQVEYTVRSTAISGIGIVLSGGAAAFLLLWWARHWTKARRARRTATPAPSTSTT